MALLSPEGSRVWCEVGRGRSLSPARPPQQRCGLTGTGPGRASGSAPPTPRCPTGCACPAEPAVAGVVGQGCTPTGLCDPVSPCGGSGPAASGARLSCRVRRATAGAAPAALGLRPARLSGRGRDAVSAGSPRGRQPGVGVRGKGGFPGCGVRWGGGCTWLLRSAVRA